MNEQKRYLSVGEVNELIKEIIQNEPMLKNILIKGEISNFKQYPNACYFSLKDDQSRINAVWFIANIAMLEYRPSDGDEVLVEGSIRVYTKDGRYQVVVRSMNKFGEGMQLIELEKLKKKLLAEGLFDENRKRPIKRYPHIIGVLTGQSSAAIKDIVYNLTRRYPLAHIYFFPSLVQGQKAPDDIIDKLNSAYTYPLDTLIIGRGGGAEEDLSAFNHEAIVRLVARSPIPVISAVGHEINLTLVDLVADKRASTPTGAAELATRDSSDIRDDINQLKATLYDQIVQLLGKHKQQLLFLKQHSSFKDPHAQLTMRQDNLSRQKKNLFLHTNLLIDYKRQQLNKLVYRIKLPLTHVKQNQIIVNNLKKELVRYATNTITFNKTSIANYSRQLKALNPYAVINRGYSILTDENNIIIDSIENISLGQIVKTRLKDGTIISAVKDRKKQ